ncbi:excalibur calcium-binding domain-containing protein [Cellulomonas soli]
MPSSGRLGTWSSTRTCILRDRDLGDLEPGTAAPLRTGNWRSTTARTLLRARTVPHLDRDGDGIGCE